MCLTSQLSATLHPKIKPSKPRICLKMPSCTPQEGPRRTQDSPRWAQGGLKKVRGNDLSSQDNSGGPLGPILGHLKPSENHCLYEIFAISQFSNPSDLKLLPTCKLPEPSLVDLKLQLALFIQVRSQHGIQVALSKAPSPPQDLQRATLQTF